MYTPQKLNCRINICFQIWLEEGPDNETNPNYTLKANRRRNVYWIDFVDFIHKYYE